MKRNTKGQKHLDDKNYIFKLIKSRVLCISVYLDLRVYIFNKIRIHSAVNTIYKLQNCSYLFLKTPKLTLSVLFFRTQSATWVRPVLLRLRLSAGSRVSWGPVWRSPTSFSGVFRPPSLPGENMVEVLNLSILKTVFRSAVVWNDANGFDLNREIHVDRCWPPPTSTTDRVTLSFINICNSPRTAHCFRKRVTSLTSSPWQPPVTASALSERLASTTCAFTFGSQSSHCRLLCYLLCACRAKSWAKIKSFVRVRCCTSSLPGTTHPPSLHIADRLAEVGGRLQTVF